MGSLLQQCSYCLPHGVPLLSKGKCPSCGRSLWPVRLLPLVQLLLGRRCCCQYVGYGPSFLEPVMGMAFVLIGWQLPQAALSWLLVSCLVLHSVIDYYFMLLPDRVTLLLVAGGLLYSWQRGMVLHVLLVAGGVLLVMLALYYLSRGGLGMGDVKLLPALALWLGWPGIWLCAVLSFVLALVVGLILLGLGRVRRREPMPFGPFIVAACAMVYFYQEWLWLLLLRLLGGGA